MKYTLHLSAVNGGPLNNLPARSVELEDDRIAASIGCGVTFPWEHGMRDAHFYVIGHAHGAAGAVWATNDQDAFDELVDRGLGDCFLIPEEDVAKATDEDREEWAHLGNASEPCNLDDAWIQQVSLEWPRDCALIIKLAEARGANVNFLSQV